MIIGFLLDLLFGDPKCIYHPVRLIGNLISFMECPILPKPLHQNILSGFHHAQL
ncbi:MAG: cobalamin biosynthesis protein [Eubacterium sp.]|nr:cobalamin biosynthesis protein [Eubacterium sp.]